MIFNINILSHIFIQYFNKNIKFQFHTITVIVFSKTKDSGTVDFEEFIGMMSKFRQLKSSNELEQELQEIFNV